MSFICSIYTWVNLVHLTVKRTDSEKSPAYSRLYDKSLYSILIQDPYPGSLSLSLYPNTGSLAEVYNKGMIPVSPDS